MAKEKPLVMLEHSCTINEKRHVDSKSVTTTNSILAKYVYNDSYIRRRHQYKRVNSSIKQVIALKQTRIPISIIQPSGVSALTKKKLMIKPKYLKFGYSSISSYGGLLLFILTVLLHIFSLNEVYAQVIKTMPQTIKGHIGEIIELPCSFSQLDSDDEVVVWKRGLNVLAIDEELITSDNRFQVKHEGLDYNLVINGLDAYDFANYTCSVTSNPPVEITHKLEVNVPPSVKLIPSSSLIIARVGEDVAVKCAGAGNPVPLISWYKRESREQTESPVKKFGESGHLFFAHAKIEDSGTYECRANNGIGPYATATVEIRIESELEQKSLSTDNNSSGIHGDGRNIGISTVPWVETDRLYIPAKLGAPVTLTCRYGGEPEPIVDWLFSGFKIYKFEKKFRNSSLSARRDNNSTITKFTIDEVHEDHFGDYTCKVANNMGTKERTIHLSGRPGPPVLQVRSDNQLSWTVESAKLVTEYKVMYRLAIDDTWTHHKIIPSSRVLEDQDDDVWMHKIGLEFLKPDTDYELQVNAKNELGWGSLARNFVSYRSSSKSGKISSNALNENVNGATSNIQGIKNNINKLLITLFTFALTIVILS